MFFSLGPVLFCFLFSALSCSPFCSFQVFFLFCSLILCIHLFSGLPCCFLFKSAILSFLFSYDSILSASHLFSVSIQFYTLYVIALSFTPVYTPCLVRIRWYSLFFLLFFLPAFSLFLYLLSVLSVFFVSFLLLFSLFFFFGSLPVLSFVCYACSHCLFFVRHSYGVVTTWRGVFLTSRTFFKAKNNIRYILNVD